MVAVRQSMPSTVFRPLPNSFCRLLMTPQVSWLFTELRRMPKDPPLSLPRLRAIVAFQSA